MLKLKYKLKYIKILIYFVIILYFNFNKKFKILLI